MKGCFAVSLLVITLVGGCASSPPSSFYTLTPLAETPPLAKRMRALSIGVGPLTFPRFLDRPQIVARDSAHRLAIDEFQRWGGSLEDEFARVWSENLSTLLGTERIVVVPGQWRAPLDLRVGAEVLAFEGTPEGGARLKVRWAVLEAQTERVLVMRETHYEQAPPAESDGVEGQVAAMSEVLGAFSRDVAEHILKVSAGIKGAAPAG